MTVACPRGFVVDAMAETSRGSERQPAGLDDGNLHHDRDRDVWTDHECSPSPQAVSSSRGYGGGVRSVDTFRGQALPLDAPATPVFATANGTIVATSVPVPVPQPTAESLYAIKLHRSKSSMFQTSYDRPPSRTSSQSQCSSSGVTVERLRSVLQSSTTFEMRIQKLAEKLAPLCVDGSSTVCDVDLLAQEFKAMGYSVWVRTAVGGGVEWFRHLQHRFLLVEGDADYPDQLYVVDPNFRDQFVLARSTRQFDRVIDALPKVFVGRGKKLVPAVQLACSEISVAFADLDMELPPWRRKSSMISKWMPERKSDYVPNLA